MSDKKDEKPKKEFQPADGVDNPDNEGQPRGPMAVNPKMPMMIHSQYIKDLSLENPHAPQSLVGGQGAPQKQVGFFTDARKLDDEEQTSDEFDFYEVVLGINIKAQRGENTAYLMELLYGIKCSVRKDVPDHQRHPMLLIEGPRYAFPFVRQIVANIVQTAGYQAFYMAPVDFARLYMSRFGKEAQAAAAAMDKDDQQDQQDQDKAASA